MKNLFHKTEKPVNHNTKLERKVKKGFRFYAVTVLSMTLVLGMAVTAHSATPSRWSTTFLISSSA